MALVMCLDAGIEERLKELFFVYDTDNDGFLNVLEVVALLTLLLQISYDKSAKVMEHLTCKICFESVVPTDAMIPCKCALTTTNSCHVSCIMTYIQNNVGSIDASKCMKCKSTFLFTNDSPESILRKVTPDGKLFMSW